MNLEKSGLGESSIGSATVSHEGGYIASERIKSDSLLDPMVLG